MSGSSDFRRFPKRLMQARLSAPIYRSYKIAVRPEIADALKLPESLFARILLCRSLFFSVFLLRIKSESISGGGV